MSSDVGDRKAKDKGKSAVSVALLTLDRLGGYSWPSLVSMASPSAARGQRGLSF